MSEYERVRSKLTSYSQIKQANNFWSAVFKLEVDFQLSQLVLTVKLFFTQEKFIRVRRLVLF